MTSALVLLMTSVLHFGLRGSCLLDIERFPVIPGTIYAGHIAYCAILHFLHDLELLPTRYRRRMGWLTAFLVELVLGVAFMEVLALWLWCSVEHILHLSTQFVLRRYLGVSTDVYLRWEWAIMGGLMTTLAAMLWINAYEATEPIDSEQLSRTKAELHQRQRQEKRQQDLQKVEQPALEPEDPQHPDNVQLPEEKHLQLLATTTDC
ncbi:uncharacterized protein LOC122623456 [Drosophila teissieri]|uniref:uncharacterized protein LOC122623456 n=1 Tax=Drosophila teissieri TaxID=7243 RepID=UPI001CB9D862|nr:uncharacterized protein LOC122623456 [Drosophila teissieri]